MRMVVGQEFGSASALVRISRQSIEAFPLRSSGKLSPYGVCDGAEIEQHSGILTGFQQPLNCGRHQR